MLFLILIALGTPGVQHQSPAKVLFDDHAIVKPRRIKKTRGTGEDRYTTVIIRPVVTGLRPPVLKNIQRELELKKVLGNHYHFYKHRWMHSFDCRVTYNRDHILAIRFTWNAYFADHEKAMAFDLRDGSLIEGYDLFREDKIPELVQLIDQKLQAELEQMARDYEGKRDIKYAWQTQGSPLKFTADYLTDLAINDKGITFYYDPYFSHTAAWAEPDGHYFFKYSELKNYLKPGSVVSQFAE